jgi:AcrR family transcriptional regulator
MATDSRQKLVQAAHKALREKGFAGASARTIAGFAGVNPGLIFYYFKTLDDLLLAALHESSADRLERYKDEAAALRSPSELVALLRRIYAEDVESGHIRVVCEMVAGSVARPALGRKVMAEMEPWVTLAEAAVERVLEDSPARAFVDPRELALGGVTFYLGANLVTHLGEGPEAVDRLMAGAERAAGMLDLLR